MFDFFYATENEVSYIKMRIKKLKKTNGQPEAIYRLYERI